MDRNDLYLLLRKQRKNDLAGILADICDVLIECRFENLDDYTLGWNDSRLSLLRIFQNKFVELGLITSDQSK